MGVYPWPSPYSLLNYLHELEFSLPKISFTKFIFQSTKKHNIFFLLNLRKQPTLNLSTIQTKRLLEIPQNLVTEFTDYAYAIK